MDGFRWILLGLGILILGVIYVIGRRQRAARSELPLQDEPGADPLDMHGAEPAGEEDWPSLNTAAETAEEEGGRKVIYAPELDEAQRGPHLDRARPAREPEEPATYRPAIAEEAEPAPEPRPEPRAPEPEPEPEPESRASEPAEEKAPEPPLVVLYLVARDRSIGLGGTAIREAAEAAGMEFGEMDIFHYRQAGESLFSLVNAVSPGYFEIESLDSLKTPAISLFMQPPTQVPATEALEKLLDTAFRMQEMLDAQLLDEHKQPVDTETVDQLRQKVSG